MSESQREQRPLLGEEGSDEESCAPECQRRYRPLIYKSRARAAVKGASVIITRWPEHWTSLVSFWWITVSMFAITTFIIYHTVIAFTPTRAKPYTLSPFSVENSSGNGAPSVFMHVFTNNKNVIELIDYVPHIVGISSKYPNFTFKIIIVFKDVTTDSYSLSAEENNAVALNSLWEKDVTEPKGVSHANLHIEHTTLSKYMNSSPLRKHWRQLPSQFVEFLVRAISIWDKGGVAINPEILTPRTPCAKYMDKFEKILKSYGTTNASKPIPPTDENVKKHDKTNKIRVNNIRDIIEILEKSDLVNSTQDIMVEAEDNTNAVTVPSKRKLLSTSMHENKTNNLVIESTSYENSNQPLLLNAKELIKSSNLYEIKPAADIQDTNLNSSLHNNKHSKLNILPFFLDFIFNDNIKFSDPKVHPTRHRKSVLNPSKEGTINKSSGKSVEILSDHANKSAGNGEQNIKPMIVAAKGMFPDKQYNITKAADNILEKNDKYQLSIDLRGNIVATETPCHAFLGSVFSNAVHHTQKETLEDFIISELSLFCKGLLSSCRGIDLILI